MTHVPLDPWKAFDNFVDELFKKSPSPVPPPKGDDTLRELACSVSESWKRFRMHEAATLGGMDPLLVSQLDELEKTTRGDVRRCFCLTYRDSGGKRHDIQCSAWKREP